MRKSELEVVLDDHLCANQTAFQNDPPFSDYYKRLGPISPIKRLSAIVKSEVPDKKAVRKRSKNAEDVSAT